MHILLIQEDQEIREKVVFFVESTFGGKVIEVASLKDAIKALSNATSPIDLIIWDSKNDNDSDLAAFRTKAASIPTLLCGEDNQKGVPGNVVGVLNRNHLTEEVAKAIDGLVEKKVLTKPADEAQVRIRTKLLLSVSPLKGDIYVRLNDSKFIKLFRQGDVFDQGDLEKYTTKKGIEYLYIRKEQCKEFAEKYQAELKRLLASDKLKPEEISEVSESVFEAVQELSKQIGFTKEVQELTKTQVQLTMKAMGKDPTLADILKKLESMGDRYISAHSSLCAYLSCAIAAQMQWGSPTTFHKLSLACFLHDITLENDALAALNSLSELTTGPNKFTENEIKLFKDHPIAAAEMAKKMTEVPPDVDTIISQHHEKPDGSGFPRGLAHSYIAPLASVFIVAHDLAQFMLKHGEGFDIEEFLKGAREKYTASQFRKVIKSIETLQQQRTLEQKK